MTPTPQPLAGKVALVTGGAGGLGSAICRRLAAAGARVVVGYNRSADAAHSLAAALPAVADGHCALAAPVTDSAALARLAAAIETRHGRLDILVNCAGTTRFVAHDDLDGLDDALIDEILATNVRGPFAAVRALHPLLARGGAGLVVSISSIAATTAMGSNIMYCASKAALDNMTRSLARALAPQVRVVSVAPGLVDTDFVRGIDADWRAAQVARTPLARLAAADDVALAVLAAATHFPFSTGIVLPVDGGRALA
ncbi:SDR family NAD(P)-dependent oxidoreductase [Telluria beijingensis]|uniref:SDR family NAD(P)-dependent oxidoreductase n=1 Tax=Telluria beijingensis TaxID=3068633 RepID=UPI0027962ABF|nr:SDR family oxidoreductase [Massilia sp. REN29]